MSVCPQCQVKPNIFDDKVARKDLKAYRKKGPAKDTRRLLDELIARGVEGLTLLDIGGGIGAIQHELLGAGVREAIDVDASEAYIAVATEESERQGHAGKVTYQSGDFVDLALDIDIVDIVTLDRVICCYPDMQSLVDLSSARASKFYGVIYHHDAWWIKAIFAVANTVAALFADSLRTFVHSTDEVDSIVHARGFDQIFYARAGGIWQIVLYARNGN